MWKLKNVGILILVLSLLLGNLGFVSIGGSEAMDSSQVHLKQEETGIKNQAEKQEEKQGEKQTMASLEGTEEGARQQEIETDTTSQEEKKETEAAPEDSQKTDTEVEKSETESGGEGTKRETEDSKEEAEDSQDLEKRKESSSKETGELTSNDSSLEEKDPKESLKNEGVTDVYYEWQTMEEILELCEKGVDLSDFFQYTIWGFLTKEDIQILVDHGHTLDDVYEAIENGANGVPEDIQGILDAYASVPMPMSEGDTRTAGFSGSVSSSLGNIPALGNGSHGPMLKIHLSGETAFCAKFGAACRTGMVYTSVPLGEIGVGSEEERIIRGLLAQYGEAQTIYNGPVNYIMAQAGIWLTLNGAWSEDPEEMTASIAPLFSKTPDCPST